jgi:glycosyltransferase involved in cell wall biosynthesis
MNGPILANGHPLRGNIIFVSTNCGSAWGGSEELWSQTAVGLVRQGIAIAASVRKSVPTHERVLALLNAGIEVQQRQEHHRIWTRAVRKLTSPGKTPLAVDIEELVARNPPSLVVLSDGTFLPPVDLVELCESNKLPFVTIGQANFEGWWPDDRLGERYRKSLPAALRCFFVSEANKRLAEKQLGHTFENAEIVRNPFNVAYDIRLPWPRQDNDCELRLANVARLDPRSKGQDILLEALAKPQWSARNWRLSIFGEGPARESLERMAKSLDLSDRVVFAGFAEVKNIWAPHHALVMPSRYEGMPLAIVEAMLCARPVVATNVAGHAEIIEDGVTGFLADAVNAPSFSDALERAWERRDDLQHMGEAAARSVRKLVPPDPPAVFSKILRDLAAWQ